jgi:DNA modification methylase
MGDNYKEKDLMMMPARVAIALQDDGWYLRSDIIWCKRAPMPESVTDRPTTAHEHIFLLAKNARYFYDADAVREPGEGYGRGTGPGAFRSAKYTNNAAFDNSNAVGSNGTHAHSFEGGRNAWSYWLLSPEPFPAAHFATFPTEIPRRAILAGTSEHGVCAECGAPWRRVVERTKTFESGSGRSGILPVGKNGANFQGSGTTLDIRMGPVIHTETTGWQPTCTHDAPVVPATCLDPFSGAGTTVLVANRLGRRGIGIELSPEYCEMARRRIIGDAPLLQWADGYIA